MKSVLKRARNSTVLAGLAHLGPRWKGMLRANSAGAPLPNMRKDLHLVLELAESLGMPLQIADHASQVADSGTGRSAQRSFALKNMNATRPCLPSPAGTCDTHMHIFEPEFTPLPAEFPLMPGTIAEYRKLRESSHHAHGDRATTAYGNDNRCTLKAMQELADDMHQLRGVTILQPADTDAEIARLNRLGMRAALPHAAGGGVTWESLPAMARAWLRMAGTCQVQMDGGEFAARARRCRIALRRGRRPHRPFCITLAPDDATGRRCAAWSTAAAAGSTLAPYTARKKDHRVMTMPRRWPPNSSRRTRAHALCTNWPIPR